MPSIFATIECRVSNYLILGDRSPFPLNRKVLDSLATSMKTTIDALDQVTTGNESELETKMQSMILLKCEALQTQMKWLKSN